MNLLFSVHSLGCFGLSTLKRGHQTPPRHGTGSKRAPRKASRLSVHRPKRVDRFMLHMQHESVRNAFLTVAVFALVATRVNAAELPVKHPLLFFEYGKGPNRLLEL